MKKRTTIYLDNDLCKRFKMICLRDNISMSEALEREIKRVIRIDDKLNYNKGDKK